jgi:hypothetical protein
MNGEIRRIISLRDGRSAVIPKGGDDLKIRILDNNGKLMFELGENKCYDGAKLSAAELSTGNFLSWGRDLYLKLWDSTGNLIKKIDNRHFIRGVVFLESGRFVAASGNHFIIYNLEGEVLKIVEEVERNYICRIQHLYGNFFITSDLETPPNLWDHDGERISTLTECGNLEILKVEQHNDKLHITCSDKPFSFISFRPRQIKTKVAVYDLSLQPKPF